MKSDKTEYDKRGYIIKSGSYKKHKLNAITCEKNNKIQYNRYYGNFSTETKVTKKWDFWVFVYYSLGKQSFADAYKNGKKFEVRIKGEVNLFLTQRTQHSALEIQD